MSDLPARVAPSSIGSHTPVAPMWLALVLACLTPVLTLAPSATAQNADADAGDVDVLWNNFNHYVLIARPDLAADYGKLLLEADGGELLDAVENGRFDERPLLRAKRTEQLADLADDIERAIQRARIDRARDAERIEADIVALSQGARPYRNAVERLAAAGPYAAPQMLEALKDPDREALHPYISRALIAIGDEMVYPLSVALPRLDPVPMSRVAQVLAAIGYPQSIPYLADVLADPNADLDARAVVEVAFNTLCEKNQVPADLSADEYYYLVGLGEYNAQTRGDEILGYDALEDKGLVWAYGSVSGLVRIPVPTEVFGDVLAMRSAKRALELNPAHARALSLHLRSNLRRENNLPADEIDPSYPDAMRPASFYAMLAGPVRMQEVLAVALDDGDPALALDAIAALNQTSGTAALTQAGPALIRALSYPDRRVRFRAAETLANARPQETFDRSFRVVPVLAEAIRQGNVRNALVLGADRQTINREVARLSEMGYEAFGGQTLTDVAEFTKLAPGIDLVVIAKSAPEVMGYVSDLKRDYKTVDSPIVAIVTKADELDLRRFADDQPRLTLIAETAEIDAIAQRIEQAAQSVLGEPIRGDEAERIALDALAALQGIAIDSPVYPIEDAELALIRAVRDDRREVAREAGVTLAMIDSTDAQSAIAEAAFQASGDLQLRHIESLAQSAINFGDMINDDQVRRLMDLMDSGNDTLAVTAARAHGALALPPANAVQALTTAAQ